MKYIEKSIENEIDINYIVSTCGLRALYASAEVRIHCPGDLNR